MLSSSITNIWSHRLYLPNRYVVNWMCLSGNDQRDPSFSRRFPDWSTYLNHQSSRNTPQIGCYRNEQKLWYEIVFQIPNSQVSWLEKYFAYQRSITSWSGLQNFTVLPKEKTNCTLSYDASIFWWAQRLR